MEKFKTREPMENILKMNPNEDLVELTELFNQLSEIAPSISRF